MKLRICVLVALSLLTGCKSLQQEHTAVDAAITARSTEAAAAVIAAQEVNRLQESGRITEVVERELEVARANLPLPTQAQLEAAHGRASTALVAEQDELRKLYAAALDKAGRLQRDLDQAREQAGRMAAGFPFGGFTQNYRIGAMCVVLGGVLLASSRIIAKVPNWA